MLRKIVPFDGTDDVFERDGDVRVKVLVPVLREETGFGKCIVEVQSYHDPREGGSRHYALFSVPDGRGKGYILDAVPLGRFDDGSIIIVDRVGDDDEWDLIEDLTPLFYSNDMVLDI